MPINMKGGKGYKKKKKESTAAYREPIFIDRQVGQMPARAIRLLGNRNVLCYSNDNIIRMCHICGKMKGRVYIEPGDVVLITLRDFSSQPGGDTKNIKLGDIIAKYAPEQYNLLKKEEGVNAKLFMKLETAGSCSIAEVGTDCSGAVMTLPDDTGFEFDHSEDEETPVRTEIVEIKDDVDIDAI